MRALSTKHVVLGLVIERPGYGYDLQQRIDTRLGFLGLSEKATYKILDRLEQDGCVAETGEKLIGRTRRGSPRLVYAATHEGREEFQRWMTEPCEPALLRDELHVKLVLSQPQDLPQLAAMTEEQEQACLAELRRLGRPSISELADASIPWTEAATLLVDDAKARRLQSTIDWLQGVRLVIERRLAPPVRRRGAP